MSTSDPDPARAPRASQNPPPTGRFTRSSDLNADVYDNAARVAADAAPRQVNVQEGDLWSHEVGARRFEPSGPRGEYPVEASVHDASKPRPSRFGPSIATKAYEQSVPPAINQTTSTSPSAFVTDALGELAAEDQTRAPEPPRRAPGARSTPPPGFSGS